MVKADLSNYTKKIDQRQFELDSIGIHVKKANLFDYLKIQESVKDKIDVLRHAKNGRDYSFVKKPLRVNASEYSEDVFKQDDICLIGYWQNPKYFLDIINEIRKTVKFPSKLIKDNNIMEEITQSNSVSVHIRLTDYMYSDVFEGICSQVYYDNAIDRVNREVENPVFYVFSDDIEGAKKIMQKHDGSNVVFMDCDNTGIEDLYLMTCCKHHILANSTFSWWGAMLGDCQEGIVVAPEIWSNETETRDIYIEEWLKVPVK